MKHSYKIGFSFGLTSGIITTLGLLVGLNSATHSKLVITGGILTIAVADSLSDALGIHVSEESEGKHSHKEIWQSTFSTFLTKFFTALTFLIPVLVFKLSLAISVSIIYGLILIGALSYYLAKKQKKAKPWKIISEHLFIALAVIIITHYLGILIAKFFN